MLGVLAVAVSTVVAVAILIGNFRSLGDDAPPSAAASPSELASPARHAHRHADPLGDSFAGATRALPDGEP